MILMKEIEIGRISVKFHSRFLALKKSILDQLSASNATWMHLNLKHDRITVFLVGPLRKSLFFSIC